MIEYEDQCVECGKPCLDSCPYKKVLVKRCDECGCEVDKLYWYEGDELCEDCAKQRIFDELVEVEADE